MIRIVVCDDQTLVRQGIVGLLGLAGDLVVVGEASTGDEAVERIRTLHPDVALLDVRMPGCDGIEVLRRCRAGGFAPRTILLTTFDDDDALRAGIAAGISGFLLKDIDADRLAEAVRRVAVGETVLDGVGARAREGVQSSGLSFDALDDGADPLTPREVEVLRLIAAGMNNREIASALGVTEGTVKNHTSAILSKLGVRDRTRAVLKALERGAL